ncbi:hypothetical protein [Geminicoccus harenae]|uniref:hypothetical protein n=2 Tax=Geminicoccus harenae TaxID=2498453 RepID=UPI001C954C88|nr:hypothetical protein [Geminicoccus harenae]
MLLLVLATLADCGDRDGSVEAALALAEAVYPGELELPDTRLQKDHYQVVLARKGDPVTRIAFDVDRDPAQCRPGTRCEERLRQAYAVGMAAGTRLKALDRAFRGCGVVALAVEGEPPANDRLVGELAMAVADQQPALDRLAGCVCAFAQEMPSGATMPDYLRFRILEEPESGASAMPDILTFEDRLEEGRRDEISYLLAADLSADTIPARSPRLAPRLPDAVMEQFAKVAQDHLDGQGGGGQLGPLPLAHGTKLDPQRLDVLRTYLPGCTRWESGIGPCRPDLAVRMTYDLARGAAIELAVLRDIRAPDGRLRLPELPGR